MTSAPAVAPASAVSQVRTFNRFYNRQIGVLNEYLLEGPLSLTETRVLYEVAHRPHCTATALCQDLGLNAGYLSRMLRLDGWVKTPGALFSRNCDYCPAENNNDPHLARDIL
jgi:hypothetical protein